MLRNGRDVEPNFSPEESLYFRCKLDWLEDGRIKPASIRFPDQSVNRERFSKVSDVLFPDSSSESRGWIHWGVARVQVRDVPDEISSAGGVRCTFTVEHDPEEDNFAHSELRVYK
jgi:hypothetical protein